MLHFIAIKIHYDHRKRLPKYLKYSSLPTTDEYREYLDLYRKDGVGGDGFHECLNFALPQQKDEYKVYLPPTCIPSEGNEDDEFVIFSFTYKGDQELAASVIGVHAGVRLVNRAGRYREEYAIPGISEPLIYHGETKGQLASLITTPLEYDFREGKYTPPYQSWGNGLRYLKKKHAKSILRDAFKNAKKKLEGSICSSECQVIERELDVLNSIYIKYFGSDIERKKNAYGFSLADTEIGFRGEEAVYQRELEYVKKLGFEKSAVEWISQSVPDSVYDIKTLREYDGIIVDHYLEVKSSKMEFGENVYLSSRQVSFFEENPENTSLVMVNFSGKESKPEVRYMSFDEVVSSFSLEPVKFKLKAKM